MQSTVATYRGDDAEAERLLRLLVDDPKQAPPAVAVHQLAAVVADRGNIEEAKSILERGIRRDLDAGQRGQAAQKQMSLAALYLKLGNRKQAYVLVKDTLLNLGSGADLSVQAASLYARAGYTNEAQKVLDEFPDFPGPLFESGRLRMEGEIQLAEGKFQQAVHTLEQASAKDQRISSKEYLARALAMNGERERAIFEYEQISNTRWLAWTYLSEWPGVRYFAQKELEKLRKGKA